MNKIITLLLLVITSSVFGQICTPDAAFLSGPSSGIYPNPSVNPDLPDGITGVSYAQTFTFKVPADTTIDLSSLIGIPFPPVVATINYLEIQPPMPLPSGLSFSCEPATCMMPGNDNGCTILQGTPTVAGNNQILLVAMVNINVPLAVPVLGGQAISVPYIYPSFNLEILSGAGLAEQGMFKALIAPNPNNGKFSVVSDIQGNITMEILDMKGTLLHQEVITGGKSEMTVDLVSGLYLVRLRTDKGEKILTLSVE
jgi:hypothetical protein